MLLVTKIWEQRKLGEIGKIIAGGDKDSKKLRKKGKYPVLANNLENNGIIGYYKNNYKIEAPAITVTARGNIGNAIARFTNFTPVVRLLVLKTNLDVKFIEQSINNINFFIESTGVPQLTVPQLASYSIFIPKKFEQHKIGNLFKFIDNIVALYERKFKLLSRVKKYFLDNLFAEKEYPNLRFKGFTNTWEKIKLKDTQTTLTDGNYANLYPKPTDMTDADKGIPFLTGGNLKDGILDLKNAKYITKEKHSQLRSGHLEEDDIVIAVRGSLGELGYVTKQNIDWNINSQLAIIRTSKNELIGNFLLYFFLSSKGKSKLLSRQTGTALKQLPLQQLKTIVIPKTLLLEQQKISNILKTIDKTISFYKVKNKILIKLKTLF